MKNSGNLLIALSIGIIAGLGAAADSKSSSRCSCGKTGIQKTFNGSNLTYPPLSGMTVSTPGKWCWQVSIQNELGVPFCSAVLVDAGFAITPAQCIYGRQPETTFIRIGAFDLSAKKSESRVIAVSDLFVHQGYRDADTRNDFNIGLIKLQTPVDCNSDRVCFACLPEQGQIALKDTQNCQATTWNVRATNVPSGSTPPRPLRERPGSIISQIDCEATLRADAAIHNAYHLSDSKFCLQENQNITGCQGDIGDPLVCLNTNQRYEVVGLNTIGFSCFRPTIPNFYTRVSAFSDWINKLINQNAVRPNFPAGVPGVPTAPPPNIDFAMNTKPALTTTGAPSETVATGSSAVTPGASIMVPIMIFKPNDPAVAGVQVHQSGGKNSQQIENDGSLTQMTPDGSSQKLNSIGLAAHPTMLESLAPGVFKVNLGGNIIELDSPLGASSQGTGQKPQVPREQRSRRGVIAPNNGGDFDLPVITVPESSVNFDTKTGKFVFNLPTGGFAVSSVSFLSTNADDVKQQIVNQQDQILAQVENLKRNILVSIGHNGGAVMAAAQAKAQSQQGPPPPETRRKVIPVQEDDTEDVPTGTTKFQWAKKTTPVPVDTDERPTAFKASVKNERPSSGSVASSLQSGKGSSNAAISFKGDRVSGETRVAPGSASSSVSASSG